MTGWVLATVVAVVLVGLALLGALVYRRYREDRLPFPVPWEEPAEPLVPGILPSWTEEENEEQGNP